MMHHVDHRKLGMKSAHRIAMLANMVSSLVLHDRIETTLPRAKEARRLAERIVTLSKRGTLHARRRALSLIRNQEAVHQAFANLPTRFSKRQGGYTRIYRLGFRHGDSAPMAVLEYLQEDGGRVTAKRRPAKAAKTKREAKHAADPTVRADKKPPKASKLKSMVKKVIKKNTADA